LAQDDAAAQDDETKPSDSLIPELEEPEQEPEPIEAVRLPDNVRLPDTHMCEAAPPPWDLVNELPPPPPIGPVLLEIDAVQRLRLAYLERCSAGVRLTVDSSGTIIEVTVSSNPYIPELQAEIEQALEGVILDADYRGGRTHKATLWTQFVRQVIEVEE
jgi:hypothetical protein